MTSKWVYEWYETKPEEFEDQHGTTYPIAVYLAADVRALLHGIKALLPSTPKTAVVRQIAEYVDETLGGEEDQP